MITLVLTNRNRDLRIVKNCLESLRNQTKKEFELFFVDYGSDVEYLVGLKELLLGYDKIQFITCPVVGQLWNKSRAINIALKRCSTPYFIVGDVDLIFSPLFMSKAYELMSDKEIYYFQYGFLSQQESLKIQKFEFFKVDFKGSKDVTGTSLFPTKILKEMNGYDEFYHGWGAEDTDIHYRMQNWGYFIKFYDESILVKHQWHPKQYRNSTSKHPYHSKMEAINHAYLQFVKSTNRVVVNNNNSWGAETDTIKYTNLRIDAPKLDLYISNSLVEVLAVLAQFQNYNQELVYLHIKEVDWWLLFKNKLKKTINKKVVLYASMEHVNNMILEHIINNYRNNPYEYNFDRKSKTIQLKIHF